MEIIEITKKTQTAQKITDGTENHRHRKHHEFQRKRRNFKHHGKNSMTIKQRRRANNLFKKYGGRKFNNEIMSETWGDYFKDADHADDKELPF